MTPAERAVIDAAMKCMGDLDDMEAATALIDACSVLDAERAEGPATFTDADGDVWKLCKDGKWSLTGKYGFADLEYIRKYYGEQK